jgi:hypothetical protein
LPEDLDRNAPPAPPPKQRFKQAIAQAQPPIAGSKRPLPSPAPTEDAPSGLTTDTRQADDSGASDGDADISEHGGKQPRVVPSLIRGIAPFRKPRVGPEFQADIPELLPRP